jgi:hypothetical protein
MLDRSHNHKVSTVYVKNTTMSRRRNWDSFACECAPPPEPGGGGAHSAAGEGLGESQFRRLEKKLSTLPTLWSQYTVSFGWDVNQISFSSF